MVHDPQRLAGATVKTGRTRTSALRSKNYCTEKGLNRPKIKWESKGMFQGTHEEWLKAELVPASEKEDEEKEEKKEEDGEDGEKSERHSS